MRVNATMVVFAGLMLCATAGGESVVIRDGDGVKARLIAPKLAGETGDLVGATVNGYLSQFYGWKLPTATADDQPGVYLVAGAADKNPVLASLVAQGLKLDLKEAGPEGFRLASFENGGRRYVVIGANSPLGLKHGCQELVFFRMAADARQVAVDWPLDVVMAPRFPYRGIYMLPCWAAHDSIESWQRIMRFNSELTLNRVWFWLNGFPLIPEYGGEYPGTALADVKNVRGLIDLCRTEGMKFYIGGGWFHWHHLKHAGGSPDKPASSFGGLGGDHIKNAGASIERGVKYYLDMVALLPKAEGLFLEPPGETFEVAEEVWRPHTAAMEGMMKEIWRTRPEFEFAVAIGRWNNPTYRQAVHAISDKITWWWCWGDPIADKALEQHPRMLRWHTTLVNGEAQRPPGPEELPLTGFATSYDPGMGFGRNPWPNQGAKMGADHARNFDPYNIPYFSHQYWFRERCWDVNMTREQFARRLARRLFDADMPAEAIGHYLRLAELCPDPARAPAADIDAIDAFVKGVAVKGTPRNQDTLARMREAIDGLREARKTAEPVK